ncbi:GGDEF domain-containing protein [Paenibacillus qinlingensis]|uniref:Diguanylate cyclase (GGDEF)-like protein n=1 Tax=Paenibacillus qinlingensis TaxID=1837343 RepID=A0ABU1NSD0_9BACL|nr:GGDEF domain-containing protein [Paenibacillus qinlingensis]MDR6550395.1 diguanylate cyclase (GGDEF)-like protein [Paenibacillus qinlingensis]
MCDSRGLIVFANGRFEELFGKALLEGESLASYCEGMKLLNGGSLDGLIRKYFEHQQSAFREMISVYGTQDEIRHYECYVNQIASEDEVALYGHLFVFGNRTEAVRKAHYDELTGLPNRRYVQEWLERLASHHVSNDFSPYGLLFLDLDGFKQVNDTYGHEIGDRLLKEVALVLNRCMNEQSTGARWAGDEFVIMVEQVGEFEQLGEIAENVMAAIQQIKEIDGLLIHISGSIGIALAPSNGVSDAKTLLQHADEAMYKAKSSGKNCYCFYGFMESM